MRSGGYLIGQNGSLMDSTAIRRALQVNYRNLALGHEVFERPGATFVRDLSLARIYDANFVFDVSASTPEAVRALMNEAESEYRDAERLTFLCDAFTPPAFEARLALDGFEQRTALVLLLEGALSRNASKADVREVRTSADWDDYRRLKQIDWRDHAARFGMDADPQIANDLATAGRLKSPPVRYLLAYIDDRAVGYCQGWHGLEACGQVEDLFVDPAVRHRGVATALLHAAVDFARAGGAGPVVIVADPTDTPKSMYAALGWRPVALMRQWGRNRIAAVAPVPARPEPERSNGE